VIQDDDHALVVLRYVEANPLRAGMVTNLAAYPWSSYRVHGLGRRDPLVSPLPAWDALRQLVVERQAYWRQWVDSPLSESELAAVRRSVVSGRPYGSEPWSKHTAAMLGLGKPQRQRGRPRKTVEKLN
jgi:putative transposase